MFYRTYSCVTILGHAMYSTLKYCNVHAEFTDGSRYVDITVLYIPEKSFALRWLPFRECRVP